MDCDVSNKIGSSKVYKLIHCTQIMSNFDKSY